MGHFEHDVRQLLTKRSIAFVDNTGSLETLDFTLATADIHFDVKEKKQRVNVHNWQGAEAIPEEHLFLLDDLAARKILLKSPRSFLLVQDCSRRPLTYYVFSIVDLLCMPKRRVNRALARTDGPTALKGKWYLDLRHGARHESLDAALSYMQEYPKQFDVVFKSHIACWGTYAGEEVRTTGTARTSEYWRIDLGGR
jgi:hypothetical protein